MTKIRKQKRKKRFRANVNRKRLRNKLQALPKIECEDIENSWEQKRSIRTNLKDMGLAYDPNEALRIPFSRKGIVKILKRGKKGLGDEITEEEIEEEEKETNLGSEENGMLKKNDRKDKTHVVNKLEADAKAPRERLFRLPKSQVQFVTYLMDKYGDDYKAMARDRKNYYQMTWCQIRSKINTFKSIPEQYAEYLLKSGEIVLDDPTPLEETRRKIGEENSRIYSAPKKKQAPKEPEESLWDVESVDKENEQEEEPSKKKNLNSDLRTNNKKKVETDDGLKKLKLFSDDESNDEGDEIVNKSKETKKRKNNSSPKENEDNKKVKKDLIKSSKKLERLEKSQSSDSDSEELDGDDETDGFINLSDMSEEELSEDDVLDDGEFVSNNEDESD